MPPCHWMYVFKRISYNPLEILKKEKTTVKRLEYMKRITASTINPLRARLQKRYGEGAFIRLAWDFHRNGAYLRMSSYRFGQAKLPDWPEEMFSVDWKRLHLINIIVKNEKELDLDFFGRSHTWTVDFPEITNIDPLINTSGLAVIGKMDHELALELLEKTEVRDVLIMQDMKMHHFPREAEKFLGTRLELVNVGLDRIPRFMTNNEHIRELNLVDNNITEIPLWLDEIPNLYSLDVSGNKVTRIPDKFWKGTSVREIKINDLPTGRYRSHHLMGRRPQGWRRRNLPWYNSRDEIPADHEISRLLFDMGMKTPAPYFQDQSKVLPKVPPRFRYRKLKWRTTQPF